MRIYQELLSSADCDLTFGSLVSIYLSASASVWLTDTFLMGSRQQQNYMTHNIKIYQTLGTGRINLLLVLDDARQSMKNKI